MHVYISCYTETCNEDSEPNLPSERVLVLIGFDVDAICACKILQYLFQCDQVLYTIVPVTGKEDLETAYVENSEGIKHVILINCGGNIDLIDTLQADPGIRFYVCDSHRPVDVHNVYNGVQVKLLIKEDELSTLPEYDLVFRDDDSDDSGNDSDDSSMSGKRRRFDEEALEKRRERRLWNENRNKVLFDYMQFSTYGTSGNNRKKNTFQVKQGFHKIMSQAALTMFELAWKMSKDTNDLLWLAIVGVTDQYVHYKTPREKYIDDVMALQSHVSRLNHRASDEENLISVNCLKILFDDELQLSLYRHWSLFESICHSVNTACKFKVWSLKGQKKLHEFLAEMGVPLTQSKQKFAAMDSTLRSEIKKMFESHMSKYGFIAQDIVIPSFSAQYGYRTKLCATDVVLSCAAILESADKTKTITDNFLAALDVLNRTNVNSMEKGIEMAKMQLMTIKTQVHTFLDMRQVISAGPFLSAFIQEGLPDGKVFAKSHCLMRLARFTLEAYCSMTRNKKVQDLPLVLGAPLDLEQGTTLVIGIPPLSLDDERKNFFGKAFEQAAVTTNSRTFQDSFDTFIMELKTEDKSKFFDALISLLQ